jgi:hypothetical protein
MAHGPTTDKPGVLARVWPWQVYASGIAVNLLAYLLTEPDALYLLGAIVALLITARAVALSRWPPSPTQ